MKRTTQSRARKQATPEPSSKEHKLIFSFDPYKNIWHYRTKTGVWRNIHDINAWGLRYILERLEMDDRTSSEVYQVIKHELESRSETTGGSPA